jgi:gluconate 5-dehydrogenase
MLPALDLTGRLALVTGSSRGLGWAFAQGLAAAGARVLLHGRDAAALAERRATLAARGEPAADTLQFDVTDAAAVIDAFARIGREHGGLDILLSNAGIVPRKPALETTDAEWQSVIDADLTAGFRLAREAARLMLPRGRGRIIVVSSIMGQVARPGIPGYVTAKAALHGMVRALAVEWAKQGVTVNAIAPGFFPTEANATLHADPQFSDWISRRTPIGRWGDPAELQGAAVFLASDAASYVTGQVLFVDGGLTAAL